MISLALVLALAAQPSVPPAPPAFDPSRLDAMTRMAERLRPQIAYLEVDVVRPRDQPLLEEDRDGFGVAWTANRVVCLSFLVEGAARITVQGPRGKAEARVLLHDVERRIAILETAKPLAALGLVPVTLAPKASRALDTQVFAMVGTAPESHVLVGQILDDGTLPELEGHPRVSLALSRGMPVFDDRARYIGFARAVAWDRDVAMLVTPEHVSAASSATTAAARPRPLRVEPWWVRPPD